MYDVIRTAGNEGMWLLPGLFWLDYLEMLYG